MMKTFLFSLLALLCTAGVLFVSVPVASAQAKPVVYLTFDDGPDNQGITSSMVDLLDSHDAKATFFVTGYRVNAKPATARKIISSGHALGNHTFDHPALTGLSNSDIRSQFSRTQAAVRNAGIDYQLSCYRPPYGASNSRVRTVGAEVGLSEVRWSIDTNDWRASVSQSDVVSQLDNAANGSIILMHDGASGRRKTLNAVTSWMASNANRFDFRVLPQCGSGVVSASAPASVAAPVSAGSCTVVERGNGWWTLTSRLGLPGSSWASTKAANPGAVNASGYLVVGRKVCL